MIKSVKQKPKINIYKTIASQLEFSSTNFQQQKQFSFDSVKNISEIRPLSKNNKQDSSTSQLNLFTPKKMSIRQKQSLQQQILKGANFNYKQNDKKQNQLRIYSQISPIDEIGETDWQFKRQKSKIETILQTQSFDLQQSVSQSRIINRKDYTFSIKQQTICKIFKSETAQKQLQFIELIKQYNLSNLPLVSCCLSSYSDVMSCLPLLPLNNQQKNKQLQNTSESLINQTNMFPKQNQPQKINLHDILVMLDENKCLFISVFQTIKADKKVRYTAQQNESRIRIRLKYLQSLVYFYNFLMIHKVSENSLIVIDSQKSSMQTQIFNRLKLVYLICKQLNSNSLKEKHQIEQRKNIANIMIKSEELQSIVPKSDKQIIILTILQRFYTKLEGIQWMKLIKILFQSFKTYSDLTKKTLHYQK